MKHYFYALGAILCWASLPAATGAGLNELSTEELMFYSFTTAALYLFLQNGITHRNFRLSLPPFKACLFGLWGLFFLPLDILPGPGACSLGRSSNSCHHLGAVDRHILFLASA